MDACKPQTNTYELPHSSFLAKVTFAFKKLQGVISHGPAKTYSCEAA